MCALSKLDPITDAVCYAITADSKVDTSQLSAHLLFSTFGLQIYCVLNERELNLKQVLFYKYEEHFFKKTKSLKPFLQYFGKMNANQVLGVI